ncbi:glyoxylase I family protein [Mariprofundus aestuarium]|uniref:Glyoxylase I family protein n=1 Tax=Mariprofundus aestuarium TaxID=1921086 RepID=A0A2K8KYC3_MARES|nr:VOC family protein [Mariprofundus aestuarium]ATX79985.1 glyoxylase I family protein [Mariprofundus aestuarium]
MFSFHHVALSVRDIESSVEFYSLFEFEPVFRWQAADKMLSIVHLKQGQTLLELFCFENAVAAPESSQQLATDLPRIGIKHFGIKVADIQAARAALQEHGLAEGIELVQGKTGIKYFFIKDPSGILLEVAQDDRNL